MVVQPECEAFTLANLQCKTDVRNIEKRTWVSLTSIQFICFLCKDFIPHFISHYQEKELKHTGYGRKLKYNMDAICFH